VSGVDLSSSAVPGPIRGDRAAGRGRRSRDSLSLALPALGAIGVLVLAPIVVFFVYSFLSGATYSFGASAPVTLGNYTRLFSDPAIRTEALNSVIIAATVSGVTLLLALPTAYWLRYCAGRLQRPLIVMVVLAMFSGYLVRIYAWRTLLGQDGIVNDTLHRLGVTHHPVGFIIFSRFSTTVAFVSVVLPLVILLLFAGFRPIDPRYLETAQDLGAGVVQRWRRVTLPLIAVPLASAFMLCVLIATSDYVTPQLLGAPGQDTIGIGIARYFQQLGEYPSGAALAVLLLVSYAVLYGAISVALRLMKLTRLRWD
jgi:spermidine/putrescine transport system permease protein